MKKVIALVTLLSLAVAFSCVAFAQTATFCSSATASSTKNNVEVNVYCTTMYPCTDDSELSLGNNEEDYWNHVTHVMTIKVSNWSSTSQYLTNFAVYPDFTIVNPPSSGDVSSYTYINDIQNFSNDFYVTFNNTDFLFEIVPSADWTFLGTICVPANSTLTAVCTFTTRCRMLVGTNPLQGRFAKVSSVGLNASWTPYSTDYTPQGSHEDLLISLEALRSYLSGNTGIPEININLTDIISSLSTIHSDLGTLHNDNVTHTFKFTTDTVIC